MNRPFESNAEQLPPAGGFFAAVRGLREVTTFEEKSPMWDIQENIIKLAKQRGTYSKTDRSWTVEPCVNVRGDGLDMNYGLNVVEIDSEQTYAILTGRYKDSTTVKPLLGLMNGEARGIALADNISVPNVDVTIQDVSEILQGMKRHFSDIDRQTARDEQIRQDKIAAIRKKVGVVAGCLVVAAGATYGVWWGVHHDPDQNFDDQGYSLEQISPVPMGEVAEVSFSPQLYKQDVVRVDDVPAVGDSGESEGTNLTVDDGLRRLEVARTDANTRGRVCKVTHIDGSVSDTASIRAYTDAPKVFANGKPEITIQMRREGNTTAVEACVNTWLPDVTSETVVFDVQN